MLGSMKGVFAKVHHEEIGRDRPNQSPTTIWQLDQPATKSVDLANDQECRERHQCYAQPGMKDVVDEIKEDMPARLITFRRFQAPNQQGTKANCQGQQKSGPSL